MPFPARALSPTATKPASRSWPWRVTIAIASALRAVVWQLSAPLGWRVRKERPRLSGEARPHAASGGQPRRRRDRWPLSRLLPTLVGAKTLAPHHPSSRRRIPHPPAIHPVPVRPSAALACHACSAGQPDGSPQAPTSLTRGDRPARACRPFGTDALQRRNPETENHMDLQLLIAQWSGRLPVGFVPHTVMREQPPRCSQPRCTRSASRKAVAVTGRAASPADSDARSPASGGGRHWSPRAAAGAARTANVTHCHQHVDLTVFFSTCPERRTSAITGFGV